MFRARNKINEGSGGQPLQGGVQSVAVAVGAEAADHADRLVAEIAGVAERLAAVRVGQVYFDEGQRHAGQCVADGDRGVGEGGRVDQDEGRAVGAGRLDAVDQGMLGIGLEAVQLVAGGLGNLIDRVLYGYVIDFIEPTFMQFAVFNIADCAVTCGGISFVLWLAVDLFRSGDGKKGTTHDGK